MADLMKLFYDSAEENIERYNEWLKYTKHTVSRKRLLKQIRYWEYIKNNSENKHSPFDEEFNCQRCGDAITPGTTYCEDCI
jgi:hypothetical protein